MNSRKYSEPRPKSKSGFAANDHQEILGTCEGEQIDPNNASEPKSTAAKNNTLFEQNMQFPSLFQFDASVV